MRAPRQGLPNGVGYHCRHVAAAVGLGHHPLVSGGEQHLDALAAVAQVDLYHAVVLDVEVNHGRPGKR